MCTKNFTYTKKFYVHEIAVVDLSKIYFLKNAKKTCKPNNCDLNRDWKTTYLRMMFPSLLWLLETLGLKWAKYFMKILTCQDKSRMNKRTRNGSRYSRMNQVNLWKTAFKKFGRPYHFRFFKGCLSQNFLHPFLNNLTSTFMLIHFVKIMKECQEKCKKDI